MCKTTNATNMAAIQIAAIIHTKFRVVTEDPNRHDHHRWTPTTMHFLEHAPTTLLPPQPGIHKSVENTGVEVCRSKLDSYKTARCSKGLFSPGRLDVTGPEPLCRTDGRGVLAMEVTCDVTFTLHLHTAKKVAAVATCRGCDDETILTEIQ